MISDNIVSVRSWCFVRLRRSTYRACPNLGLEIGLTNFLFPTQSYRIVFPINTLPQLFRITYRTVNVRVNFHAGVRLTRSVDLWWKKSYMCENLTSEYPTLVSSTELSPFDNLTQSSYWYNRWQRIEFIQCASNDMIFTTQLHENPLIEGKCLLGWTPCSLSGIKEKSFRRSLLPPSSGLRYKVPHARRQ
jgi:hypothetical protein